MDLYQKACDGGEMLGCIYLGVMYENGKGGLGKDAGVRHAAMVGVGRARNDKPGRWKEPQETNGFDEARAARLTQAGQRRPIRRVIVPAAKNDHILTGSQRLRQRLTGLEFADGRIARFERGDQLPADPFVAGGQQYGHGDRQQPPAGPAPPAGPGEDDAGAAAHQRELQGKKKRREELLQPEHAARMPGNWRLHSMKMRVS